MTIIAEVGKDSKEEAVRVLRLPDGSVVEAVATLCDCTCKYGHVALRLTETAPAQPPTIDARCQAYFNGVQRIVEAIDAAVK